MTSLIIKVSRATKNCDAFDVQESVLHLPGYRLSNMYSSAESSFQKILSIGVSVKINCLKKQR